MDLQAQFRNENVPGKFDLSEFTVYRRFSGQDMAENRYQTCARVLGAALFKSDGVTIPHSSLSNFIESPANRIAFEPQANQIAPPPHQAAETDRFIGVRRCAVV